MCHFVLRTIFAVLSGMGTGQPATAQPQPRPRGAIASAPVDPGIYKEGQFRRLTGQFGAWGVVCDEVIGLKRRYCSLRAQLAGGGVSVPVTVSTGDDGRPAAILRLPHGVILSRPIILSFAPSNSPGGAPAHQRTLRIFSCDRAGCAIIWTLGVIELRHLRQGDQMSLRYTRWRPQPGITAILAESRGHPVMTLDVSGTGFAEAVQAALQ